MCLIRDKGANVKRKTDKDGFCIGWKILERDTNQAPYRWVHGGYQYAVGENISNRTDAKLTDRELTSSFIYEGLHLHQTRKAARLGVGSYRINSEHCVPTKIVKVFYKPEDVVDYGLSQVAVHKLTIKSLKNVG